MLHEPTSGYDIKKQFNTSLRHFWAAELSQIYPLLRRLEQEGLLESHTSSSSKGPQRVLYKRTRKGTAALVDWLAAGPSVAQERRHYLAQVFFLEAFDDPDKASEFMRSLRTIMLEELATLEAADRDCRAHESGYPDALPDEGYYRALTLRLGLKVFAVTVEWCDECIAEIKRRRPHEL